jgi:hypothetical protein
MNMIYGQIILWMRAWLLQEVMSADMAPWDELKTVLHLLTTVSLSQSVHVIISWIQIIV